MLPGLFHMESRVSVFKLIQKFAARTIVPVEVDDVVEFIRRLGVKDEIFFWEADISPETLQAAITHWEYPLDGKIIVVADIHTARCLPLHQKRVAQVKELLHILDPEHFRVNTLQDVHALIEKIILPPDLVDWENDGVHANSDRAAIVHALAVLFPWAARELLIGPFKDEKITLTEMSELLALPPSYIQFVLSDIWVELHEAMVGPQQMRWPDKVTTLKADHSPIEVYTVPFGDDPYSYARKMHERNHMSGPIAAFRIERGGVESTLSVSELAAYKPPMH